MCWIGAYSDGFGYGTETPYEAPLKIVWFEMGRDRRKSVKKALDTLEAFKVANKPVRKREVDDGHE